MGIQEAYRNYADKKFTVNRRYQRKLVWTSQEKRHLIDSVLNELPIPLFMFAKSTDDPDKLEIIDGMQRLNAIFSFMEHQFTDEQGRCFDLEQSNRARLALQAGEFSEFDEGVPRLSAQDCAKFLEYQLAVTIDSDGDEARINEVFGRINSGGRQLSPQEQRQAGLVSNFSEFVRKLALQLRGDSSPDILSLNEMPEVSFDTPTEKQRYGIDAAEVFWCKHGIMPANDLARSLDEQILADFSISLLNEAPLNASREVFDGYFAPGSEEFENINAALASYGEERLRSEIIQTIGAIRSVFEENEFHSFRNCVHERARNPARTTFFAVFFAFHDLMFRQSMFPDDAAAIRRALENSQRHMIRSAHHSTTEDRTTNVRVIKGLVSDGFVKKDVAALAGGHGLAIDLENSLRRSKYESSRYEFKLGICQLSKDPKLDDGMYSKLARTACAIANTNPRVDGYLYLGVADKDSASIRVKEMFGIDPIKLGNLDFIGLEPDLKVMGCNIEDYVKQLILEISKQDFEQNLKTQLLTSIEHAEYQGRAFVRIRVPGQDQLSVFEGQYPVRINSETVDLAPQDLVAQLRLFAANPN